VSGVGTQAHRAPDEVGVEIAQELVTCLRIDPARRVGERVCGHQVQPVGVQRQQRRAVEAEIGVAVGDEQGTPRGGHPQARRIEEDVRRRIDAGDFLGAGGQEEHGQKH
jgi:hypothetical protein